MILYHSSDVVVERPDVVHSREFLDFGKGFYLTSIHNQAISPQSDDVGRLFKTH